MVLLFNIFSDVRLFDYNIIDKSELPNVYIAMTYIFCFFCLWNIVAHIREYYVEFRKITFKGFLFSIVFVSVSTFIFEYIFYFFIIQIPFPISIVLYGIFYIIRGIHRSVEDYAIFTSFYRTAGDYFDKYERKYNNLKSIKKQYIGFYNVRKSVNYKNL